MPNLLIHEQSPYLLEHAENPVDWHPFGDEAFALAAALDRPVFVSVGYMSCHWCHVMARESFENDEVAALLNARFVSVKVDREERPDVDALCMRSCQMMTGSGGWPLSVFMTPERAPFFAGTYFPPHSVRGHTGFIELLQAVADAWASDRGALVANGARMLSAMDGAQRQQPGEMRMELIEQCVDAFRSGYDSEYGGFSRAPKFPTPHVLTFLMDCHRLNQDAESLDMAVSTLRHMAMGGVFDQLGGGFCRYSTDRRWLVPHFEKMLYDNALLLGACARAFTITRDPLFADAANRTLDYLLREMRAPEGGFYSAQDADSEGREGAHYLLSRAEVIELLGEAQGGQLCDALDISTRGNFEGLSIPNRIGKPGLLDGALHPARERLYQYRRQRMALRVDTKLLTAWNALVIAALAEASHALGRPDALQAAREALRFIDERLTGADGELLAVYAGGVSKLPGTLDDYAFLSLALIRLYDVTLDPALMRRAEALLAKAHALFSDDARGGYFLAREDGQLPVRPKEDQDNALPCGNSAMAHALLRVARWTDAAPWHERADAQMRFAAGTAQAAPGGNASALSAGLMWLSPSEELVCVTADPKDADAFLAFALSQAPANATVALCTPETLEIQPDWVRALPMDWARTTYYRCQNGACSLPVHDLASLARQTSTK